MARDEKLNQRIRDVLESENDVGERNMFGGTCFLFQGNMVCGAERYAKTPGMKHVREMDFTGRPMKGFIFVDPPAYKTRRQLQ